MLLGTLFSKIKQNNSFANLFIHHNTTMIKAQPTNGDATIIRSREQSVFPLQEDEPNEEVLASWHPPTNEQWWKPLYYPT